MSVEDIFLVRFDFIEHSKFPEFQEVLNNLVNTEIDFSASLSKSDPSYSEVFSLKTKEQIDKKTYDALEFNVYSYHGYLLVQTRLCLSERTRQQWLPASDRAFPRNKSSNDFREYSQVVSKLNQICSDYPSLVNQVPGDNSPTVLHCAITDPPESDSVEEWIERNTSSLRKLDFTQTSGLQTIVDGTYLASLYSFPDHDSGIIAINIFTPAQDKKPLSRDAENLFKHISQYHLAHYVLAKIEYLIESRAGLSFGTNDILGKENLDELIEMESTLINNIGWYSDIQSDLQPQNPVLNIEFSIDEKTVHRNENADLANTTYFEYYHAELSKNNQMLINSIESKRHQNERLLDLIRDRVSAIGTQKNIKLQRWIAKLTIITTIAAVISLIVAFADHIQLGVVELVSRLLSDYRSI